MHISENYWFNSFFGLWTMLRVFELNVKNPAFAKQKNSSNAKGFLWRTKITWRSSCLITDAGVVDWDQHREKILQLLYHWSHYYKILMKMMDLVSNTTKYKMQTTQMQMHFSLICQSGEHIIIQICRATRLCIM